MVEAHPDEDVHEDDTGDAPDAGEPQTPINPEADSSTGDNVPQGSDSETHQTGAAGASMMEPQVGRAPRILVPETRGSGSPSGTQHGWTTGSLVNRHRRPTHTASSPISRPSSASTSQHRPS
ncbi:unnamed protein product [Rhizoctonia solani]|uniref:Uncharacterized protein n=1 Tax=Rhizoctonia solani TaxID=456999 RepID=A0A8H2ZY38_9AGAM|nr:unnamed protein product [Rhizoctonia solani]